MSDYEITDLTASVVEVASSWYGHYSTWVTIYLTLVFGFCVVAYVAAHSFSRLQATMITALYALAVGWSVYGIIGTAQWYWGTLYMIEKFDPNWDMDSIQPPIWIIYAQRAFWLFAALAPIWFFWSVRRGRRNKPK